MKAEVWSEYLKIPREGKAGGMDTQMDGRGASKAQVALRAEALGEIGAKPWPGSCAGTGSWSAPISRDKKGASSRG